MLAALTSCLHSPNIPLSSTLSTLPTSDTALLPYIPPHPQQGTPYHRYTLLLLAQPAPINLDSSAIEREAFSVRDFVSAHELEAEGVSFWRAKWDASVEEIYSEVLGELFSWAGWVRGAGADDRDCRNARAEVWEGAEEGLALGAEGAEVRDALDVAIAPHFTRTVSASASTCLGAGAALRRRLRNARRGVGCLKSRLVSFVRNTADNFEYS